MNGAIEEVKASLNERQVKICEEKYGFSGKESNLISLDQSQVLVIQALLNQ